MSTGKASISEPNTMSENIRNDFTLISTFKSFNKMSEVPEASPC